MKYIRLQACFLSLTLVLLLSTAAWGMEKKCYTFFEGTQYPLEVYFLKGGGNGPTVMVQGGIQGDEAAGFLTAQLLTMAEVDKGNLIIVPRANVPSIHLNKRQINVDMNRRFDRDYNSFYEDRLARVVRFLLAQSDALIHLHEGSGFYDPKYVDSQRNPKRWGQSIIVDTLVYEGKIDMGSAVESVLKELNPNIKPRDWQFRLFNTKTFENKTNYPEMRKTLTCYALTALNIPALAVEVSKSINELDWKVKNQLEATVMLLNRYGVQVKSPKVPDMASLSHAEKGIRVLINGRTLKSGGVVELVPGSTIKVQPLEQQGNLFSPALAVFASDRPGVNLLAAPRMVLESFSDLELRSDGKRLLKVNVRCNGKLPQEKAQDEPTFVCWLNGKPMFVRSGEVLRAVTGDQLILEGVWGSRLKEIVNLKGYVAKPWENDGQDMGWEIVLDPDNFMPKYRSKGATSGSVRFKVVRETPKAKKGSFHVEIEPRKIHALRLLDPHGQSLVIPWTSGGKYPLPRGEYELQEAWSNGPVNKLLTTVGDLPLEQGDKFRVEISKPLELTLRQATTFTGLGTMTFTAKTLAKTDYPTLN